MGIKEFANKFIEKQKESNEKIKESLELAKEKNKIRTEVTKAKISERNQIFNSKKEIRKQLKEEEKEHKRKEFERIMASNPQVIHKSAQTKSTAEVKENIVCCPKCGSKSITAQKKGFGLAKGAAGVFVAGAYGVVAAGIGKNKILITCLNCGYRWKPGKK